MRSGVRAITGTILMVAALAAAATPDARGEREIAHLLDYVATSGCRFVRNGTEYPGPDARKHLAGKYDYARSRLASADEFIVHVASTSSMSGEVYLVRCGVQQFTTRKWLEAELARYRAINGGAKKRD